MCSIFTMMIKWALRFHIIYKGWDIGNTRDLDSLPLRLHDEDIKISVATFSMCITLQRGSRWRPSISSFTLSRACSGVAARAEDGANEWWKDFTPPSWLRSSSCLLRVTWRKGSVLCQWAADTQTHRAQHAGPVLHDLAKKRSTQAAAHHSRLVCAAQSKEGFSFWCVMVLHLLFIKYKKVPFKL